MASTTMAKVKLLTGIQVEPWMRAMATPIVPLMPGPMVGRNSMTPARRARPPEFGMPTMASGIHVMMATVMARNNWPRSRARHVSPSSRPIWRASSW